MIIEFNDTVKKEVTGIAGKAINIIGFAVPDGNVSHYQIILTAKKAGTFYRLPSIDPTIDPMWKKATHFPIQRWTFNVAKDTRVFLQVLPLHGADSQLTTTIHYEIEDQQPHYAFIIS